MMLLRWRRSLLLLLLSKDGLTLSVGERSVEEAGLRFLLLHVLGLSNLTRTLIHLPVSGDSLRCSLSWRTCHLRCREIGIPLLTRRSTERRLATFIHGTRGPPIAVLYSIGKSENVRRCGMYSLH